MEVQILNDLPPQWKNAKPLTSYETSYVYTGFRKLDTTKRKLITLQTDADGRVFYAEDKWEGSVLSKAYATELVRVIVYSETPRVWVEELSPTLHFVFLQRTTK